MARSVQLRGPDAAEVTARVEAVSAELACIETKRRTLMRGLTGPLEKLRHVQVAQMLVGQRATMAHVQALAKRGLQEIANRFAEVDRRLGDMLAILRDTPAAIAWLRRQRDWLFRTEQAWAPVFADWANAPNHVDEFLWKIVERTYQFPGPQIHVVRGMDGAGRQACKVERCGVPSGELSRLARRQAHPDPPTCPRIFYLRNVAALRRTT